MLEWTVAETGEGVPLVIPVALYSRTVQTSSPTAKASVQAVRPGSAALTSPTRPLGRGR
jgi:hypothetical protein